MWLGPVRQRKRGGAAPTFMVLFRDLQAGRDRNAPFKPGTHLGDSAVWVELPIALLPILFLGQIWRNGRVQACIECPREVFRVRLSDPKEFLLGHRERVGGSNEAVLPGVVYPIGEAPRPGHGSRGSPCLHLPMYDRSGRRREDHWVVLPCLEVARFFYATSSRLARALFSASPRSSSIAEISWDGSDSHLGDLYDPERTATSLTEEGIGRLRLRESMRRSDLPVVSRLAFSAVARRGFRRVSDSYVRNMHSDGRGVVEAFPPFVGEAEWYASGIWYHTESERGRRDDRFLVLALHHCDAPFPFEFVEVVSDSFVKVDAGAKVGGKSAGAASAVRESYKQSRNPRRIKRIVDAEEVTARSTRVVHMAGPERFGSLRQLGIEVRPERVASFPVPAGRSADKAADVDGAVGEPTYNEDALPQVEVEVGPQSAPRTDWARIYPGFDDFVEAVELAASRGKMRLEWRAVDTFGEADFRRGISSLETARDGKPFSRWVYIDSDTEQPRHVMIAELVADVQYAYVVEIERRPEGKPETFAYLVLSREHGERFTDDHVRDVLTACRRCEGVWRRWGEKALPSFRWGARNHPPLPAGDEDREYFISEAAAAILAKVMEVLHGRPESGDAGVVQAEVF
jgi:hypothetical protein